MTLNLTLPVAQHTNFSPKITVIGVGGGGTNAVNNMISLGLEGVEFVVANTDEQSLTRSKAEHRVQLGPHLTQGLGAGAKPEIGRAAAEEATEELAKHLDGIHMVFITAGMGGGTGTGAAPIIARMARERGVLTVGVVTKPFDFEGPKRRRAAEAGIEELQQFVDTLIVIPNQNLFQTANEKTTFAEAFKMADNVLFMGVGGVTDLMVNPGMVNLDFADIRTVMAEMGKAMMGTGQAEGEDRAVRAAESAINNPLLEDTSMRGAKGVLINITGGYDMTLYEVDAATNRIRKEVDEEANIIFGTSIDEMLNGQIRVSVVATGIDVANMDARPAQQPQETLKVVAGGRAQPGQRPPGIPPVMNQAPGMPPRRPVPSAPMQAAHVAQAGGAPLPGGLRQQVRADASAPQMQAAALQPTQATQGAHALAPQYEEQELAAQPERGPVVLGPSAVPPPTARPLPYGRPVAQPAQQAAPPPPPPARGFRALFQQVTGSGSQNRRPAEAPAQPQRVENPARPDSLVIHPNEARRPAQQTEMGGIDIPTFLRRQQNPS